MSADNECNIQHKDNNTKPYDETFKRKFFFKATAHLSNYFLYSCVICLLHNYLLRNKVLTCIILFQEVKFEIVIKIMFPETYVSNLIEHTTYSVIFLSASLF